MDVVFQSSLPFAPWTVPHAWRMPGTMPLDPAAWLLADDAFAAQMALRDRLVAEREAVVTAALPEAAPAVDELLGLILAHLTQLGHRVAPEGILRPDGVTVPLDHARPLATLARLVQEDLCLLAPGPDGEPRLIAAALCFPAGWRLAQKLGRGMVRIHTPVAKYDDGTAARVARLFAALHPERPLWRANAHWTPVQPARRGRSRTAAARRPVDPVRAAMPSPPAADRGGGVLDPHLLRAPGRPDARAAHRAGNSRAPPCAVTGSATAGATASPSRGRAGRCRPKPPSAQGHAT